MKKSLKILILIVSTCSLLSLLVIYLIKTSVDSMGDYPAEDTFSGYFNAKPSLVNELKGSGVTFMGHDVYIRFKSARPLRPKNFSNAQSISSEKAKLFFLGVFPDDNPLLEAKEFSCEFDPGSKKSPSSNGTWYCSNSYRGVYWFRDWWIS